MANNNHTYAYSQQLRTIFLHFVRAFSGFNIQTGRDANGNTNFLKVPALWGDQSRQAAYIVNQNSENTILSVPRIACYCSGMTIARDRAGWQGNQEDLLVSERKYDRENGVYESTKGHNYQVTRLYPNPLDITMKVDILTSNMSQKCQLFEQIYLVFNPVLEMQISSNPLHWTAIKRIELLDIEWDSQPVPAGTEDQPDIMSFTFKVEADINPPARVKKQRLINTIITEMGFGNSFDDMLDWEDGDVFYNVVTPGNHTIRVENGQITLLGAYKNLHDENGNIFSWPQLVDEYGELQVNYSKMRLRWISNITDDTQDIIVFIDYHPTIDNILLFSVDPNTLPAVTLSAIDMIIDPHVSSPGSGLPTATIGQRYLITNDIGSDTDEWGVISAKTNDIISFDGSNWVVAYDASISTTMDIVTDNATNRRFRLVNHEWIDVINGEYLAGYWRLVL